MVKKCLKAPQNPAFRAVQIQFVYQGCLDSGGLWIHTFCNIPKDAALVVLGEDLINKDSHYDN